MTQPATLANIMAARAYVSPDGTLAVLDLLPGSGPADALDALAQRTGSRAWRIVAIRGALATYERP